MELFNRCPELKLETENICDHFDAMSLPLGPNTGEPCTRESMASYRLAWLRLYALRNARGWSMLHLGLTHELRSDLSYQ